MKIAVNKDAYAVEMTVVIYIVINILSDYFLPVELIAMIFSFLFCYINNNLSTVL